MWVSCFLTSYYSVYKLETFLCAMNKNIFILNVVMYHLSEIIAQYYMTSRCTDVTVFG